MSAHFVYEITPPGGFAGRGSVPSGLTSALSSGRDAAQVSSRVLVLLHGTGGTERDLIPYGQRIASDAVLVGVRGRSLTEGSPRWFRRLSMTEFDQAHIREEAKAFVEFLPELFAAHGLDPAQATFVGYSNGANFITAIMLLYPHVIGRAILLRPMMVLDDPPEADLSDTNALLITGEHDPYRLYVAPLEDALRQRGAICITHTISAGHELARADLTLSQAWMSV